MKEVRNCIICQFGKFTVKTTSLRKTCCTACSRTNSLRGTKKWHEKYGDTSEYKAKQKAKRNTSEFRAKEKARRELPKNKAKAKAAHRTHYDKIKNKAWFKAKTKEKYAKDKSTPGWKAKQHEMYMKRKMEKLNNERD